MEPNFNHVILLTRLPHRRIAHALGVSVSTIRAWNNRRRVPGLMHQVQLLALARLRHSEGPT